MDVEGLAARKQAEQRPGLQFLACDEPLEVHLPLKLLICVLDLLLEERPLLGAAAGEVRMSAHTLDQDGRPQRVSDLVNSAFLRARLARRVELFVKTCRSELKEACQDC